MSKNIDEKKFCYRKWWKSLSKKQQRPIIGGVIVVACLFLALPTIERLFARPVYHNSQVEWMEAVAVAFAENKMRKIETKDDSLMFSGAAKGKRFIVFVKDHRVQLAAGEEVQGEIKKTAGQPWDTSALEKLLDAQCQTEQQ